MSRPRVLLADDASEMLEMFMRLLGTDFDIVALTQNGEEALESALRLDPDLVILDISMPLLNGIQVASRLRERGCNAKVIFVTVHEDRDYVEGAFAVGALGYVLKYRIANDLVLATEEVLQGHAFTSPLGVKNSAGSSSADARNVH
jgi:DNA-binding NarL/FixJ family response regulator